MFFSFEKRPANTSTRVPRGRLSSAARSRVRRSGREGVDVDAQRLAGGVPDADAVQVVAHVAAGREHLLAAFVRELHVPLDESLHGVAEPPARELRKIRMVEGDERNAAAIRDIRRRPRRMECVADLDEVGLERVDGARPAHGIQRQAIVERAGHEPAGDRRDVAGRVRAAVAGHDEAVTPAGVLAHPLVLCEQVALHATAGGRIEERGIDDMHE